VCHLAHEGARTVTIAEKKARLSAIADRQKALKSNFDKAGSFTKEERDEAKALRTEVETLKGDISALEAQAREDAELLAAGNSTAEFLNQGTGRVTQPDSLGSPTGSAIRIESVPSPVFKTLGEQLQAIAAAGMSGDNPGSRDPRLKWETLTAATGAAQAGVPSDGGYLIQKQFSTDLLTKVNETAYLKNGFQDVFKGIRMIPIGADFDGLNAPTIDESSRATGSRWGGIQMYWGAENDVATAKKPKLRTMAMELIDLIGLAYVSNRLLRDASAMQSIFMQAFSEETTFMLEDGLVNGNGSGMPLGILNCPALVSVAKETGQAATTVVKENIDKMWSRMWGRSRMNSVWLINQDVEPQLANLNQGVGIGGVPAYMPPGGLSDAPFGRLKGRPVVPVEYCATMGTVGDIILADLTQIVGIDKDQMQADSSIHVRFTTNENTFRFIYRFNAQPIWNTAITPYKGSNTLSPFVALATRS
jgi:HK97 family phage major capsid protein